MYLKEKYWIHTFCVFELNAPGITFPLYILDFQIIDAFVNFASKMLKILKKAQALYLFPFFMWTLTATQTLNWMRNLAAIDID